MRLSDLLGYADIRDLAKIAETYGCRCDGHSKHELIQSILSAACRRNVFEARVDAMNGWEIRFWSYLLFERKEEFDLGELIALIRQSVFPDEPGPEGDAREAIVRFKQLGWLFSGHLPHTRHLYRMPGDVRRRLTDALAGRLSRRLIYVEEPTAYRDEKGCIGVDVVRLLGAVADLEPQLTASGVIHKRYWPRIIDRLAVPETEWPKAGWRFGYGRRFRDYPDRFALLYDYCYYRGWVEEIPGKLVLTENGRRRLLDGAPEPLVSVFNFWMKLYRRSVPNLRPLVCWIVRLTNRWTTAESLAEPLVPLIRPFYFDSPRTIFESRVLRMMVHLGLVRVGQSEGSGRVVRRNEAEWTAVCGGMKLD